MKIAVAILVILVGLILLGKRPNAHAEALAKLVAVAAKEEARPVPFEEKTVPVTKDDVELVIKATLNQSASNTSGSQPRTAPRASSGNQSGGKRSAPR